MKRYSRKPMKLGKTREGKEVYLPEEIRAEHMQVLGSTGEGKSKFLEHMIREDIKNKKGVCLIDPHGTLYDNIVEWCESYNYFKYRNIVLFNPTDKDWTLGFNPLNSHSEDEDISFHVDSMVEAIAKVWGGEDTDTMPQLSKALEMIIHTAKEKGLSLYETKYLINPYSAEVREYLTKDLNNSVISEQWEHINSIKKIKEFNEEFGSGTRRLLKFLIAPIITNILGQTECTLNTKAIMDEGGILLVNLARKDKLSFKHSKLLGSLLVNDLFLSAQSRGENSRPFYLYIDECGRYINEDIANILDECRKFGLHLTLSHQHLEQLRKDGGESVYQSVMTDAKTKVVFGGLPMNDLKEIVPDVFAGNIDLEESVKALIKPTVVGQKKESLHGYTTGRSSTQGGSVASSSGGSSGSSSGSGNSNSGTDTTLTDKDGNVVTGSGSGSTHSSNYGTNESENWSDTESNNWSDTESEQHSQNETYVPVYKDMASQVYNLDTQIYKKSAEVKNLLKQHALIKLPKEKAEYIKVSTVKKGHANKDRVKRAIEKVYKLQEITKPTIEVEEVIEARCIQLERQAKGLAVPVGDSDEEFTTYRRKHKKTTS